jgi:predicted transcriptional regulator of viral defense system
LKQNISLGSKEVELLSTLERERRDVFTVDDARSVLADTSHQVVRNLLSGLAAKGRVQRIKRGVYLLVPFRHRDWAVHELSLVPVLARDAYVSFGSALRFWGMTARIGTVVTAAVRRPVRERAFQGTWYRFVALADRFFFGHRAVMLSGRSVRVATREKAVLDSLLHPEHCGGIGEVARVVRDHAGELDWARVGRHLHRMDSSAVERRLAYILHHLGLGELLPGVVKKGYDGYRPLDPRGPAEGPYDGKFGLRINVGLDEVMS